jgi:GT2 family glycosyltransferase
MTFPAAVIVPSYNRRASLARVLDGLSRQTAAPAAFEVVVVLDGNTDDSEAMLEARRDSGVSASGPTLRWVRQANGGQAAARNHGARIADAQVLIFIDDDIVPRPGFVAAHLSRHTAGRRAVVQGPCPLVRSEGDSFYHLSVWAWWEDYYAARCRPGRAIDYRDFAAGNFSIRREDFLSLGGFDARFRGYGGEDFEMGYRLLKAGLVFDFAPAAVADHHHHTRLLGVLRNTRQEAHGDHLMATLHPELLPTLRLSRPMGGWFGRYLRLMMAAPWLTDTLNRPLPSLLGPLERLKLRGGWSLVFSTLRRYAYWRGVRDVFGSQRALVEFLVSHGSPPESSLPTVDIEIADGLPAELPTMPSFGPVNLRVLLRGQPVGRATLDERFESSRSLREEVADALLSQASVAVVLAGQSPAGRLTNS